MEDGNESVKTSTEAVVNEICLFGRKVVAATASASREGVMGGIQVGFVRQSSPCKRTPEDENGAR
jgi:hypothetical protein